MLLSLRCLLVATCLLFAGLATAAKADDLLNERVFKHYATLLASHLQEKTLANDGLVSAFDYRAALDDSATAALLEQQDALLADVDLSQVESREQAIAFWNNAYNYFMLQKILTDLDGEQPVSSVWDYGGRFNPFRANVFEQALFTIGGEQYSLNGIEKGILLGADFEAKGWKEARVHFTVNCASVGCPPLRQMIYTAANIDAKLTENTRRAFNTPRHLRVDGDTLYLTELFKWYEDDYVAESGSVRAFIQAYADPAVADKVAATTRIRYIDYDWTLNSPEHFSELR